MNAFAWVSVSVFLAVIRGSGTAAAAPAQDTQNTGADPRGVEVIAADPAGDSASSYSARHALVIGIDQYDDYAFPDLKHAVADAEAVARILVEKFAFPKDRVLLIRNQDASKQQLARALDFWVSDKRQVQPEDLLVVFFAGHGVTRDLSTGRELGCLVPADGKRDPSGEYAWDTLISMRNIADASEAIPAKHVLFILDCCFGGLAIDRSSPPVAAGLRQRARQVLTAGSRDQVVADGGAQGHSVFTAALLEALSGKADTDGDQVIAFGEMFHHVAYRVELETKGRQTPLQSSQLPGHEGGWVALFPPGIKPSGMTAAEQLAALKRTADEQLAEIRRLNDLIVVRDIVKEADGLWPRYPTTVPAMRSWLGRAREAKSHLPEHEESLLRARQEAYLSQIVSGVIQESDLKPIWEKADPALRWRHETSLELVQRLRAMEELIADVEARIEFAETIHRRSIGEYAKDWEEAINEIAFSEKYGELEITPQIGLVPMGPDSESGLWEFWHVETGARPERDENTQKLILTEEMGLVFVLIPGGTFTMGAVRPTAERKLGSPNVDESASGDEGPLHQITLDPFLLSKYEMTQGQWSRFTQHNPSWFQRGMSRGARRDEYSMLEPVDGVSYEDCEGELSRLGLVLPTEAQWEYAARAGTTTVYWCGDDRTVLSGVANLADQSYDRSYAEVRRFEDWNDHFPDVAPIGSFKPNPFGLHDVHGNLWEWCRDWYLRYDHALAPGTGERMPGAEEAPADRVDRGGGWGGSAFLARSSARDAGGPSFRGFVLGVRPARVITE